MDYDKYAYHRTMHKYCIHGIWIEVETKSVCSPPKTWRRTGRYRAAHPCTCARDTAMSLMMPRNVNIYAVSAELLLLNLCNIPNAHAAVMAVIV